MNSDEIFEVIERIAATSSKNEKEKLVKANISDPEFVKVLAYTYNPFKTYGIIKMPERQAEGLGLNFSEDTWHFLDQLISRKLSGNEAKRELQAWVDTLSEASANLLKRIILKDLRAGFSESTCNKALKGLIPVFPYMRCSLPKDADLASWSAYISQEKADGMFMNMNIDAVGGFSLSSRQGSPFPLEPFAELAKEAQKRLSRDTQTHGEMLVVRDGKILPREEGNGIMNSVLKGGSFGPGERPFFMAWDQIPLRAVTPKGKYEVEYRFRLKNLLAQLPPAFSPELFMCVIPTKIVKTLPEAYAHAAQLMREGKEGSVVKNPAGIWRDTGSSGSKDQVKLKLEFVVDLKIRAIVEGRAETKNAGRPGSLTCESSCGLLVTDVAVKNEKMRDEVEQNPEDWVGRIVKVVANDITNPSDSNPLHSLFLPRLAEAAYRTDKTTADTLPQIIAQKEAAIFGEQLVKAA